jgi:hypothetical protein
MGKVESGEKVFLALHTLICPIKNFSQRIIVHAKRGLRSTAFRFDFCL